MYGLHNIGSMITAPLRGQPWHSTPPQYRYAGTRSACARCYSRASPTWRRAPRSPRRSRPVPHLPAAGSLATYAAQGLHKSIGFLVAWGYVLVGILISPLVLLQLGFTTASTINSEFPSYPANLW